MDDYFPLEHDDFRGLCLIQQEEMLGVTHPSTSCMNKMHSTSLNYNNTITDSLVEDTTRRGYCDKQSLPPNLDRAIIVFFFF